MMFARAVLIYLAALLGFCVLVWALAPPAKAHEWYSWECCSDQDCGPLPAGEVEASPAGWRLKSTGEVVPYGDPKERESKDSDFHACRFGPHSAPDKRGTLRCLYTPGMGS